MRTSATLALLIACAATLPASAQEPAARDRTVYVPIEDFDKIFDKDKGGVFVPYSELRELIRRAQKNRPPVLGSESKPPTDYLLVGANFNGRAGERVVQFTATFDVEVLAEDRWVVVPIGLEQASLEEVRTTGGERAAVAPMSLLSARVAELDRRAGRKARPALPKTGYGIILKGAGRVQTTATFALPIDSQPGRSSFRLSLPRTALARFEVSLPQAGLAVNVKDAKGKALATEVTSAGETDKTRLRAYFGDGAFADVSWNPRPKEEEGATRDPLLFASTETSMRLDEGVLQTTTRIDYRILQAPCGEFKVTFPSGFTLLGVSGQNMSAFPTPKKVKGGQQITVRLHEKAKDTYKLEVRLEKILKDGTKRIAFPRIATDGTERESGILAARTSEFLTLEPDRFSGLSQIDATSLTPTLVGDLKWRGRGRPPLVFRYLRQPYGLTLKTSTIEPEVDGKIFTLASIRDDEIGLATNVRYTIRKRGIFGVRLRLPEGLKESGILKCGNERVVKDYRVEPASEAEKKLGLKEVLVVDFVNQVKPGRFDLAILAQIPRPKRQGDTEVKLGLPRFGLLDVKKETGVLAVGGQTHLEISDEEKALKGLTPVAVRELRGLGFAHRAAKGESITLGYKYLKPETIFVEVGVKKRESKLTAKVETLVDAQEDRVKVDVTIICTVEYAGIDQLQIRVPKALATKKELKFDREGLKYQTPAVQEDGTVIWTVAFQGKRIGTVPVKLTYDIKLDDLRAGDRKEVPLHEIKVLSKCFSETGDIALTKHENLVVTEVEMTAVEKRDKRELSDALKRKNPIQAYRYVSHPHNLVLQVTKYDFRAPLGMLINHLHHDEVIARDGKLKAEATLSLQNNAEQYLTVLLPERAVMRGLKVDGKSEEWSEGEASGGRPSIQVHLGEVTKSRRDKPFQIQLRYNVPAKSERGLSGLGTLAFQTLSFPLADDKHVPVARLTRSLYLPDGFNYLDFDTDATRHFEQTSLWEDLKTSLGVRTGRRGRHSWRAGKNAALSAVVALKGMSSGAADGGLYPTLELPQAQDPFLFEKLDNPSRLAVKYASWSTFYIVDLFALLAVVGLGLFLTIRKITGAVPYVAVATGLAVLGAAFLGKSLEPYFASGLAGALGLGGFFLSRGLWRELTVHRHERRLAELDREEELARTRASAAGAEAQLRGDVQVTERAAAPAETPAAVDPKAPAKGAATAEEIAAAEKIELDEGNAPEPKAEDTPKTDDDAGTQ